VDMMRASREAKVDSPVEKGLAHETLAQPGLGQEIDGALLEDARANRRLDLRARAGVDDDGFDAAQMQEMGEQQPRGSRTDDADLRPHVCDILRRCMIPSR